MGRKVRQAQTSFYRGELSALLAARSDRPEIYGNGAETIRNLALLVGGGARTRPGTPYMAILGYTEGILVDFVFNTDQRYIFHFSDARADIYNPAGTLLTSLTGAPWTSAILSSGKFTWAHDGDTLILCHPDMVTQKVMRTGASTFTLGDYEFEEHSSGAPRYQPYYKFAPSDMTLTPSGTTGSITLTLSSPGAWTSNHVGAIVRYEDKEIEITGYTSATVATGTVRETLGGTSASADWDEQVFSAARGYAHCAEFYLNRLWFGGAKSRPTGIWASKIGAYFNFDLGSVADNDAIWDAVGGKRIAEVRHLVGSRHMLIFGDRAMFYVPHSAANPMTPGNFEIREQVPYGCAWIKPQVFDGGVLFVQSTGAVVRDARWSDIEQAYEANPVSLQSSHLIASPTAMAMLYGSDSRPEQYALLLNGDGALSVYHSIFAEKVAAWVPWATTGGSAAIKSICAADEDVFLAVERTLNGSTVWTLEKLDDDAAPLDCSKSVTISPAGKTFTGFTHLANEQVNVWSNGHSLGTYTVTAGGDIVLDDLAPDLTEIEAGFAFTQQITPMPAVFDLPEGESRGLIIGVVRTMVQVDQSAAFAVDGDTILLGFAGDDFTSAAPTKTGIVEVHHLGYDKDGQKDIVISDPAKVTILGLTREVLIGG